mmetsp:Transcript_31724/g.48627  ORF Transcript_31724/g.48627 Transcript_31724/m.48627 type:complete len:158 (-) Transcript_31724:1015-1488(-)
MKYIGYIEISVGVGLGIGPTLGSFVYGYLGYEYTMYVFGILNFLALLTCSMLIPGELNQTASDNELAALEDDNESYLGSIDFEDDDELFGSNKGKKLRKDAKYSIGLKTLIQNKHSLFAIIVCFFGTFNIVFFQGFMSTELVRLGLPDNYTGYVYGS